MIVIESQLSYPGMAEPTEQVLHIILIKTFYNNSIIIIL